MATNSNKYLIDGVEEAKSVLRYLGIEFHYYICFDEAIAMIAKRQNELCETYGVNVEILKALFSLSLPLAKRIDSLNAILKVLK